MCRTSQAVATALLLLVPGVCAAQSVNMGSTFHALEGRARRVTTTFPDAVVEVRRNTDHVVEAVLRSRAGVERSRLRIAGDARRAQWQGARAAGRLSEFSLPEQSTVSLDWAAYQLYALHVDEAASTTPVDVAGEEGAWDGHVRRSRRALGRGASAGQLSARVERVETEFDEVIVRTRIDTHPRAPRKGPKVDRSRFTAVIVDRTTGAQRGFVRWFDTAQVLTWKIEGGSQGVILPDRMPGGWTFTPTMAWANVQAYQFATQIAASIDPVEPVAAARLFGQPGVMGPLAQVARLATPLPSFALAVSGAAATPAVSDTAGLSGLWARGWAFGRAGTLVNEPGCDNLHWLDGTIFRACCDQHDKCYETNGCTAGSWWWPFSGSWSCQKCNAQVVYCFCTFANPAQCGGAAVGSGGSGGAGGGGCTSVAGGFCPIECQTCQAQ
ncbi:hypothetical protein [Luteitalea sp.]|uniref:hypothetical protein n=1 Tax=Luteitalea sp. TaxID=2004800 RepID=UPI000B0D141F|nr:hypothetical protein [Luteitalea sp.]